MTNGNQQNNNELMLSFAQRAEYIPTSAVIACYDDLRSTPRISTVELSEAASFIENIAAATYEQAHALGGRIPFSIIRELSENLIHAHFCEPVISIFDSGNTIRFTDQGPGIEQKELVQGPGFTSATEEMKAFIRGVGSGLPIVKDYLELSGGTLSIEDNVSHGCVVTISLIPTTNTQATPTQINGSALTTNQLIVVQQLHPENVLGVTDIRKRTGLPDSSIHAAFTKLEQQGLVIKVGKKRMLSALGQTLL